MSARKQIGSSVTMELYNAVLKSKKKNDPFNLLSVSSYTAELLSTHPLIKVQGKEKTA